MVVLIYYLATLVILWFIYNILVWGLNIQFGYAGVINFAYITFVAIGAYVAGVATLGPARETVDRQYIMGWHLPFAVALLMAGAVAGIVGALVGAVALRRLRSDYLGVVTVAVGIIFLDFISNYTPLFNGFEGIAGVPEPFSGALGLDPVTYSLFYVAFCGLLMGIAWLVVSRIGKSPFGRTLRAIRDDADVAEAFGKDTFKLRLLAMVIGCVFAGVGGALLVGYIGAWSPAGWSFAETFLIFAALLVGGRGNNLGSVVGVLLLVIVFIEGTRFLPPVPDHPALISAVRNMAIALLLIGTLWLRPQGLIPEPRRRLSQLKLAPIASAAGKGGETESENG